MSEPVRHSKSKRSRKKQLHFAKNLRDELEFLHKQHKRRLVNINYALDRIYKLINRLKAK